MKLATRMTWAIGGFALLLFGGSGWLQLSREEQELRRVAESSTLLLGKGLATAFENALRDRQLEDVAETLGGLAGVDPSVSVFLYDSKGKLAGSSLRAHPSQRTIQVEAEARHAMAPVIHFELDAERPVLRVGLRLRDEARGGIVALVLEKPLVELSRDLRETRRGIAITTASFVLVVAALTWLLSRRYVATPLERLVRDMRKLRSGEFGQVDQRTGADEVCDAQAEFALLVQDLRAAHVATEHEVAARRSMERGLQDADKLITLGQLSAVMAHEIGSPLQILEGRARALHKHADEADSTRRTAEMLVEQTERITRIVGQMLSLTRRRVPTMTSLDATASVGRVVELLELEAQERGVALERERRGDTQVLADADQLQQVILNLTRNALEASCVGDRVIVRADGHDDQLLLEIEDFGVGLSDTVRAHLFEPFFTTKSDVGGSGLGLSAVRSIVLEHRGCIEFVKGRERGCLVRVTLPKATPGDTT